VSALQDDALRPNIIAGLAASIMAFAVASFADWLALIKSKFVVELANCKPL
jgi:hypothetical protein